MSAKSRFQRSGLSKISKSSKKLDRIKAIGEAGIAHKRENAADMIWQDKEEFPEYNHRSSSRKSLAWDSAFFTSPGVLDPEELFETVNISKSHHGIDIPDIIASAYSEQELLSSTNGLDTRRSLAWDSAFFTSEGVLDPEELSVVNKGFENSERNLHPQTQAKVWRSAESSSTITSDGFSLASLELDLFDDLKSSSHKLSRSSRVAAASSKSVRENGLRNTQSLKKLDSSSRVRHAARSGNCSSITYPKPPKISDHSNSPSTAHGGSTCAGLKRIKVESKATTPASGHPYTNISKRPCLGTDSTSSGIFKSTSFSKSPFLISKAKFTKLRCSALSDAPLKSPVKSLRQKLDTVKAPAGTPSPSRQNAQGNTPPVSSINQRFSGSLTKAKQRCRETSLESDASRILRENGNMGIINVSKKKDHVLTNVSVDFQPSGLRKPSPKIGYFDEEISMTLTPNGDLKFRSGSVQTKCSKTRRIISNHHNGSANKRTATAQNQNKPKCDTLSGNGNKRLDSQGRTRILRPSGIRSSYPYPALFTENKGTPDHMKIKKGIKNQCLKDNVDAKRAYYPKGILYLDDDDDNKENLRSVHNQVDGLCRNIESICIN